MVTLVFFASDGVNARPEPVRPAPRPNSAPLRGFGTVAVLAPWVFIFGSVSQAVMPALVRTKLGGYSVVFAGMVTATTLFTCVLVQPWLRPWPPRRAGFLGLASGAAGFFCGAGAAAAMWPPGVLVAALLFGCGYGGCLIAGLRFIESNVPSSARGRATGIFYALTYTGFASPLVLAAVGKRTGDVAALLGGGAVALVTLFTLGALSTLALRNETPPQSGAC
jgi:hypothetical protein